MDDRDPVADIDLKLLDMQQDLVRIVVLISSVLVLQGITFLVLAWIVDGFVVTAVTGLIGGVISIVGLLVWAGNFRAYGRMALWIDEAKENHPAVTSADDSDSE